VQVMYVPHLRVDPTDVQPVARMSAAQFRTFIQSSLKNFAAEEGLDSTKLGMICLESFKEPSNGYSDPEEFRKNLYKELGFEPPSSQL